MNPNLSTESLWQSGRLVQSQPTRRFVFGRSQWLGAVLLLLAAVVLALYVAVLERDVDRSALAHQAQREHAAVEAHCEDGSPGTPQGGCAASSEDTEPVDRAAQSQR